MRGGYTRDCHSRGYDTVAAAPLLLDRTILITYIEVYIVTYVLGLPDELFKGCKTLW